MSRTSRARPSEPPPGVRLVATDVHWSDGEGRLVEAPIQDLLLGLTGRVAFSGVSPRQTP